MLKKQYLKSRPVCKITVTLPASIQADTASIVGTFNDWDPEAHPLRKLKTKQIWRTTVELTPGETHQFRYLVDGQEWHNDDDADAYVPNSYGSHNSVVEI